MSSFLSPGASAGCLYAVHCEDSAKVSIIKFPPFVLSMAMVKSQLLSRSSLSSTIIGILPYEPLGPDELEPAEPRMGQIENRWKRCSMENISSPGSGVLLLWFR